jgi:dinuclear metal center YbgI/SA1388 family protein
MVTANSIVRFLNSELNVRKIPDSSRNGMQVAGKKTIDKVGFAVDACLATFAKAKSAGVDMLVVHHGLKWRGARDVTGLRKKRIGYLKRNRIALYACHLPLDLHAEYGNNAQLANILGLTDLHGVGKYHGISIGFMGKLARATTIGRISAKLNKKIRAKCVVLPFGKKKIRSIGIVSGGGAYSLAEAHARGLDCLIIGEASHHVYHEAKDLKMNLIVAGHYETETVGVKALMPVIRERFGVKTTFLDVPTAF